MTGTDKKEGRVVLPSTIIPNRYDIKLKPDLEAFTFTGEETVVVDTSDDLGEECKEITMHAKELCFISASYKVVGQEEAVEAVQIDVNLEATTVTFHFPSTLPPSSQISLTIHFTGFLNNQMAGFYRSTYTDIHNQPKIMASTQFEALDARRAFPCWDEPARKAIFGVTLIVPSDRIAFSNMPEKSSRELPCGKLKEITYLDSPKMSSYLVAFVIGEFDYVQTLTKNGVLIKVYTPPGKSDMGDFALTCAVETLDLYDDFFGVPYPLPKLDMVGIPEFAAGAMENWGLVTYREVDVLIDPAKASAAQKQRVCAVVAHELAHQWFGNLVTMAWWDDLWLNEGFATWMMNFATDKIFPQWKMWDQFITDVLAKALQLDALRSSHPIQVPIGRAEEVEEVFDAISYCKGSSVIRMIHAVLGNDAFQKGLGVYMERHQYGNTETYNLWDAWGESSGLPINEMMASWTEQMGFPVLKVVSEEWKEGEVTLELEQAWFLANGSSGDFTEEENNKTWTIPIITCTPDGTQDDITFMREKTATVTVSLSSPGGWVKLNAQHQVPMRVLPSSTMMERLAVGIKSKTLPPADRVGLLADSYALLKAGMLPPDEFIKLLSYYTNEDDAVVWQGIESVLGGLDKVFSEDDCLSEYFSNFARDLVSRLTNLISWDPSPDDGHLTSLLRGLMIRLLSKFCHDDPKVVMEAKTRFAKFQEDPENVLDLPREIRSSVFKILLKNGGPEEYEAVKSYYYTAAETVEKKNVLLSLGSTPNLNLKIQTLDWTTSGEVKLQDFFYPMVSVSQSSKAGRDIAWKYYQDNFSRIKSMIGKSSPSLMNACVVYSCGGFCTVEKADEIEEFFKNNELPQCVRKIAQATESIRANAGFFEKLKGCEVLSDESFWKSVMEN